jgi:hypothetical protein
MNRDLKNTVQMKQMPILILLSFLFVFHSTKAQAFIRLTAELNCYSISYHVPTGLRQQELPPLTNEWTVQLTSIVGTNAWQCEGNFSENGIQNWYYDGTNTCVGLRTTKQASFAKELPTGHYLRGFFPENPDPSRQTVNIYDVKGGWMPGGFSANIAWLAFCSASYLKVPERRVPLPVIDTPVSADSFYYQDVVEYFEDDLRLPRSMKFLTSQGLYDEFTRQTNYSAIPDRVKTLKPGVVDATPVFRYTVLEHTNLLGWHFPLEFEFVTEHPVEYMGRLYLRGGRGRVLTIGPTSVKPEILDSVNHQRVVDFRLWDEGKRVRGLSYRWTNSYLPSANDPVLVEMFSEKVRIAPYPRRVQDGAD